MKHIWHIQIIYGDGTSENFLSTETYSTTWERARKTARIRGTIVRCFACVNI